MVLAVNLILKYHPFSRHYQGSIGFNISHCRDVFLDIHLQQGWYRMIWSTLPAPYGVYLEILPKGQYVSMLSLGRGTPLGVQNPCPWKILRSSARSWDLFPNTSLLSIVFGYTPWSWSRLLQYYTDGVFWQNLEKGKTGSMQPNKPQPQFLSLWFLRKPRVVS